MLCVFYMLCGGMHGGCILAFEKAEMHTAVDTLFYKLGMLLERMLLAVFEYEIVTFV